jgi:hypothetical protein
LFVWPMEREPSDAIAEGRGTVRQRPDPAVKGPPARSDSEAKSNQKSIRRHATGAGRARAGGRGEAIRNFYYSYRQLPPGHDPGADSGEAPTAGSVAHGH